LDRLDPSGPVLDNPAASVPLAAASIALKIGLEVSTTHWVIP
jgi:hypothetical protein